MILNELFTAITHVATQLTGRWFPPPHPDCALDGDWRQVALDQFAENGLAGVDYRAWVEILEIDASSFSPALKWMDAVLRSRKLNFDVLAEAAVRHFKSAGEAGGAIIPIHSEFYPPLLRQIARPPLCLSILGDPDILLGAGVAVIGSRKASYEALKASVDVGMLLAGSPWTVVSGGAIGCDIAAHEGMLASSSGDIAAVIVFAGGLHARFPRCNERVFRELRERGGVFISERLWFQDVLARDFPSRNRIVSGMSEAVAVMAAAPRSGSLITAQEALEQGRDVYVFDAGGDDARMEGSRQLINDGAFPFISPNEFLEYLAQGYAFETGVCASQTLITCQSASYVGTFDTEQKLH